MDIFVRSEVVFLVYYVLEIIKISLGKCELVGLIFIVYLCKLFIVDWVLRLKEDFDYRMVVFFINKFVILSFLVVFIFL